MADNPPAYLVIEARLSVSVGDYLRKNLHFWQYQGSSWQDRCASLEAS